MRQEGKYSNDPDDSGGETWEGISRKNYPALQIWKIVDSYKTNGKFLSNKDANAKLSGDSNLQSLVDNFYYCNEWVAMRADSIPNQSIANFLVDWEVNGGIGAPVRHLQEILGVTVDGKIGSATIIALDDADAETVFYKLQAARKQFYIDVVAKHSEDKKFLSNWLDRNSSFKFSSD